MRRIVGQEAEAARARGERLRGVFHAFSEDADTYRALRGAGDFLFGIGGVVTFKKSQVAETVREMALDEIVLETDCPYLTPVPHRGERNESAYVRLVCEKIAQIKGLDPEEVAAATTANAARMFGLSAGSTSAPAAGTAQTTARDDVSNSRRATDYEPTDTPQP